MTTFSLCISGDPSNSQAHQTALNFIQHCYQQDFTVDKVFFYGDAIFIAQQGQHSKLQQQWRESANQYGFTTELCIGAAEKRGITAENLIAPFKLSGLGELADIFAGDSKFIHFKS